MSVVNVVKKVKMIYPEAVTLVKVGESYHEYERDSYILANLFDYKLRMIEENYYFVRLPR